MSYPSRKAPGKKGSPSPSDHQGTSGGNALAERALAELVRYYRYSAVGRRCAGIVHNLNTPLQVLSFQLELMSQKAQEEAALFRQAPGSETSPFYPLFAYRLQKLGQMQEEVEKLRQMIHHLALQALHEGVEDMTLLDLNQVFQEELALYEHEPFYKHRVKKDFAFDPLLPPLMGHYIDFSQSFRNLVDNALEAMADSPARVLTVRTRAEGNHRLLQVGDTGDGIPEAAQAHLFEPFFSTKASGSKPHPGLGLFMVKRLLTPYRAEIEIKSQPSHTLVTVRIPIEGR